MMKKLLLTAFTLSFVISNYFGQGCAVSLTADKQKICSDEIAKLNSIPTDLKSMQDFSDSKKVFDMKDLKLPLDVIGLINTGKLTGLSYPIDTVKGSFNMNMPGVQLKNVIVSSGKIKVTVETDLKQDLRFYFQLPYFKINGKSLTDSIIISGVKNTTPGLVLFSKEIDLTNAIVDFSAGNPNQYNIVSYKVKPSIKITTNILTATEIGNLKIDLQNLKFTENVTYKWYLGGTLLSDKNTPMIEVNKSGDYKITTISNCGEASKTISIVVNPKPEIKFNKKDTTIVNGNKLTIKVTGAKTYLWNNNSDKDSITVKDAGTYTVTGTNEFGCISTNSITIKLREKGVGLSTINGLNFVVSPNPASEVLHIALEEYKNKSISIVDLKGNLVFTQALNSLNTDIQVNSFAKGIYLLNIHDGYNTILNTQRIVIE